VVHSANGVADADACRAEVAHEYDLTSLRFVASVGEPLNPEVVVWSQKAFGIPAHDNWWQTETGGIMIANFRSMDVRPGSMGRPLPGIEAAVARRDDNDDPVIAADGTLELIDDPDEQGELVLRPGWPSMFRTYLGEEERYGKCFAGGWSIVKAFVSLAPGVAPGDDLRRDLLGFGRKRLGAAVAPREIEFVTSVPRNRSGKIMRRLLKARELGLAEGDVSTLEPEP
jgi:acyl-coenzyme A synthetase/AMP-(fatty) acid ligase